MTVKSGGNVSATATVSNATQTAQTAAQNAQPAVSAGQGAATTGGTSIIADLSGTALIVVVLIAGYAVIPSLASVAPEVVNSLLLLILIGAIGLQSSRWLPIMQAFTDAVTASTINANKTGQTIQSAVSPGTTNVP